ncbi:MAG TPA: hypothetical protein VEV41_05855 [Terriglobales bacterium]|nr:hypothetical protein [Terriglobales bacterium]
MSGPVPAGPERAKIFSDLSLILTGADPTMVRFYGNKAGVLDRMDDGAVIRAHTDQYELSYPAVLNLGRLYASVDTSGQHQLIDMAGHQMRRDSPFCRYTPQLFVFLAKYFDFSRALETVLAHLKMDELGWYSLMAVLDFIAHDHASVGDAALETQTKKLIEKLKALENETYERPHTLPGEGGRGPAYVAYWRAKNTAKRIVQQIREVRRVRLEKGLADSPVLRNSLVDATFKTGDPALDGLLQSAQSKFLSNNPELKKEALEKLWDAWERLKTLEPGKDKKDSARVLLDKTVVEPAFRAALEAEAKALTDIGNNFAIRHTEVGKIPIASAGQVEYFFHRMFSLIRLILRSSGRGG